MQAEIISIGDEIVRGQNLDTNSQWLSRELLALGIKVLFHTTVADELQPNVEVFRAAIARADVVIATGGLGPTADDLTREVLAAVSGKGLVLEPRAMEHIRGLFAQRRRPMPPQNEIQAYFPAGSQMIDNPHGTAPGIFMEVARPEGSSCLVFALPGVPAEMRQMWPAVVERLKAAGAGTRVIRTLNLHCFGAGESQVEAMLPDLIRRGRIPTVGITASQGTITLRIFAEGGSEEECQALIQPVAATIRQCLGKLVYGSDGERLQYVVLEQLAQQGKTLATAECGTGAQLAAAVAPPSIAATINRGVYRGGLAGNEALPLLSILGRNAAVAGATESGRAIAESLARGCREQFQADFGLALGRSPESGQHQAGPLPVFVALATREGVTVKDGPVNLPPDLMTVYHVKQALNMLRLRLMEQ